MADSSTIASLATAGGTLVLAVATFASVRSGSKAARTAERALQLGLRPLLFGSRLDDPDQKIRWGDDHWARLGGGRAHVEAVGDAIYLAISLRNVGSGLAVIHAWRAVERTPFDMPPPDPVVDDFRPQSRDLFIPPSDIGFWQAAVRDPDDPQRPVVATVVEARSELLIDLLYSDGEGGQRAIGRFMLSPVGEDRSTWLCAVVRHWNLDRPDPRG